MSSLNNTQTSPDDTQRVKAAPLAATMWLLFIDTHTQMCDYTCELYETITVIHQTKFKLLVFKSRIIIVFIIIIIRQLCKNSLADIAQF